jgi:hypothetical protein
LVNDNLVFSKIIEIKNPITNKNSKLLVSSNNEQLLKYKTENFQFSFVKKDLSLSSNLKGTETNTTKNSSGNVKVPENLDAVFFEFIEETTIPKGYSLNIKKKNTKVLPPSQYYFGYDTKSNWLRLLYYPIESDENGILYKWGAKMGFFKKWDWDKQWRWIEGYIWYDIIERHPYCGLDTYKLGISAYSNNLDNIDIQDTW